MENTDNKSDKSFVAQSSDKPFIRTMEDDLRKIKSGSAGSGGRSSAVPAEPSRPSTPIREVKRPEPVEPKVVFAPTPKPAPAKIVTPTPVSAPMPAPAVKPAPAPAPSSAPIAAPKPAPAPMPSIPKNLPIDHEFIKKEEAVKEKLFSGKKPAPVESVSQSLTAPVSKPAVAPVSKPAAAPVVRPVAPVSSGSFARKTQRPGGLDDIGNLSPEARLARQTGLVENDGEYKESLIMPPPARSFSEISEHRLAKPVMAPEAVSSKPPSIDDKKRSIEEIIKEDTSDSFFKKFAKSFFIFLIILGVVAGGYYFYISRRSGFTPPISGNAPSENYVSGVTEITIDIDPNANLSNLIRAYFANPMPSGLYRVMTKDEDRNSLSLENLNKRLGISLPDPVGGALEQDYNLIAFNYPEKNYLRLGLVLKPKKTSDISAIAKNWESGMYKNIEPLFMGDSGIYDPKRQFGSNSGDGFSIRYLPLGYDNIGLNYAINNEKSFLLVATSKDDIFSLIDKIIRKN